MNADEARDLHPLGEGKIQLAVTTTGDIQSGQSREICYTKWKPKTRPYVQREVLGGIIAQLQTELVMFCTSGPSGLKRANCNKWPDWESFKTLA